jgi:hypothetical protein
MNSLQFKKTLPFIQAKAEVLGLCWAIKARRMLHVGSTRVCDPVPEDTDVDFMVLAPRFTPNRTRRVLMELGFREDHGTSLMPYSGSKFASWRHGNVNVVIVQSWKYFNRFRRATEVAEVSNMLDKTIRLNFFKQVMA